MDFHFFLPLGPLVAYRRGSGIMRLKMLGRGCTIFVFFYLWVHSFLRILGAPVWYLISFVFHYQIFFNLISFGAYRAFTGRSASASPAPTAQMKHFRYYDPEPTQQFLILKFRATPVRADLRANRSVGWWRYFLFVLWRVKTFHFIPHLSRQVRVGYEIMQLDLRYAHSAGELKKTY